MKTDIFIPCHSKDHFKLPYVVDRVNKYIKNRGTIFVCTPSIPNNIDNVVFIRDELIIKKPWNFSFRSNWIYQQFLKLSQNVTQTSYYFVLDADVIIMRDIELFEDGKPVWHYGNDQNHQPYYNFQKAMGIPCRVSGHTWIGDMGLYSTELRDELIKHFGGIEKLMRKSQSIIKQDCYMCEADFYMDYVMSKYPGFYKEKQIVTSWAGWYEDDVEGWNEEKFVKRLEEEESLNKYDTFVLHSYSR